MKASAKQSFKIPMNLEIIFAKMQSTKDQLKGRILKIPEITKKITKKKDQTIHYGSEQKTCTELSQEINIFVEKRKCLRLSMNEANAKLCSI